jgi:non-reducing end alpha-L-arabinofuranosidase
MKTRINVACILAMVTTLFASASMGQASKGSPVVFHRPQGPCDIYAAAGNPCVAAHSTTRALYAAYNGPLYQVLRQSDGKALDIGVIQPNGSDAGGYANAGAQDAFCTNTICVINLIYDQSPKHNHLYQAPPGTFKGPAKGGFDTQPIADMAPITINGHEAYGVYIIPGMGFRNNNAVGIAINDDPEGIYYVVDGTHYDSGCCFDYGNSSTNSRAVGTGTMETTYFGNSTVWGSGEGNGPWIMSDMEAGLFSGYGPKKNEGDPALDSWRFVTAVVDGGGGNRWDLRGGNAQTGVLKTFYSGIRPGSSTNSSYYPMHKQGGILLGTGGDNGNGSSGTFYEGVMTAGYPSEATTDAVQANIVAARYDVQRLSLSRAAAFTPGSAQGLTETFTNTTGAPVTDVSMSIALPNKQWTSVASIATTRFPGPIVPGASVSTTFKVISPARSSAGLLVGRAQWTQATTGKKQSETASERVRSVPQIKINEVRFGAANSNNQFIELYNASTNAVDLSGWTLVHAPSQWAQVKLATIPGGTKLGRGAYYLLGLSGAGLASPASPGATTIHVNNAIGFVSGQKIDVDGEVRTVVSVGTAATSMTTVFVPVSTGPWITIPTGSTNMPVTSVRGFELGQQIGIDIGGNYEVRTVTKVGKAATQTILSAAASVGATNLKVAADADITVGDTLTVGTGEHKELVSVTDVGTTGASGTGVNLASPLQFAHMSGVDVSDAGSGISFSPATSFSHRSGDAVQALGSGIKFDRPLTASHIYGAPVVNPLATTVGYQGSPTPNTWFGSPLSTSAGSIALMDSSGVVVDAIVYGSQQSNSSANGTIASPEFATLVSDQSKGGCIVVVPPSGTGFGSSTAPSGPNMSVGRFPDGADAGRNCTDFVTQAATTLLAPVGAGAINIKIASVANFDAGQTIMIDTGVNLESAVIATVGSAGATTIGTSTAPGTTAIAVANVAGFTAGQTITIGSGTDMETAVISATSRRGGAVITVAASLTRSHAAGEQVSGTGIALKTPLAREHAVGTEISNNVPTPGAPNKYSETVKAH